MTRQTAVSLLSPSSTPREQRMMRQRLPLELEIAVANCCRDQDREETFEKADPTSHWAKTRWTSISKLRLVSRHWDSIVMPLMYESYDLVLKNRPTLEESFQDLTDQVTTVSKIRAPYIRHVCAVVRISKDQQNSLSRMIRLLADFIKSLPELRDFWMLFQTTAEAQLEPSTPVRVFAWDPQDMAVFHQALAGKTTLRKLSLISESLDDQPTVLLRMASGIELFESLPNLETLSLRGCIPVENANEFKDLSKLSRRLTKLKIHNAGILRTHHGLPTDAWHFSVHTSLPLQLTRLALVLVDTSVLNLLHLLASAANTLERLSLMGVFLTDSEADAARVLDEQGMVRDPRLAKQLKPLQIGALSFGRVACLAGGASASPATVGSLLRWLITAKPSTITDLCLQASDSFGSCDVVNLLRGPQRPQSLKNLLWWHQDGVDNAQAQQAQQASADIIIAEPQLGSQQQQSSSSVASPDVEVQRACREFGITWLTELTDSLMDCLVQD